MRKHSLIIGAGIASYIAVGIWVSALTVEWSRFGCEATTPIGPGARIAVAILWPVPIAGLAIVHTSNWLYAVLCR